MPSAATFHSSEDQRTNQQMFDSLSPFDAVIFFLITALCDFLQIQYQPKHKSPFDEHPIVLLVIFLTLSMYAIGLMVEFKLRNDNSTWYSIIIKRFNPFFGILVIISLMIIFFPLLGLFTFILWALLMVKPTIKSFQEVYQWFNEKFSFQEVYQWFRDKFSWTRGSSSTNGENVSNAREENRLPV